MAKGTRKGTRPAPNKGSKKKKGTRRSSRKGNGMGTNLNGGWDYAVPARSSARSGFPRQPSRNVASSLAQMCCVMSNPFDPRCKGCKFPDGQNGRSLPIQVRASQTLQLGSTLFSGAVAPNTTGGIVCFAPDLSYGIIGPVSSGWNSSTNVWAFDNSYGHNGTYGTPSIFTTYGGSYRIVCWGIHFTVISSVPNTSGVAYLNTYEAPPAVSTYYHSGQMAGVDSETIPLATGASFTWVSKNIGPRSFVPQSTAAITGSPQQNFTSCILEVVGGVANATTILAEYVFNIEFQVATVTAGTGGTAGANAGIQEMAPADPPASSHVVDKIQHVQRETPHVITGPLDKVGEVFTKVAENVSIKGLEYVMSSLEGLLLA